MKLPPDWSEFISLLCCAPITLVEGLTFSDVWERLVVEFGECRVPGTCGRAALLENKRAAGRPKDLADITLLTEGDD